MLPSPHAGAEESRSQRDLTPSRLSVKSSAPGSGSRHSGFSCSTRFRFLGARSALPAPNRARSAIAAAWRPEEEAPCAGPARPWGCSGAPEPRAGVRARSRDADRRSASPDPCGTLYSWKRRSAEEEQGKQLQRQENSPARDVLRPWLGGPCTARLELGAAEGCARDGEAGDGCAVSRSGGGMRTGCAGCPFVSGAKSVINADANQCGIGAAYGKMVD
ncbi:hypothetical protein NDU88_004622 [Pleurodeles waltl]|uniref:Uncharacterized protein n=1 Tax=Pleurodeles waltl TaxID=8319 RepID=A0AAV7PH87_PLEWA|nr:hypothetical protein NDU88_004622 [Pleurodeles waltl]